MAFIIPLYTSVLFHCYMLDESNFQLMGVRSILALLFYFDENPENNIDPDQTPQ